MNSKEFGKWDDKFYKALKVATKARKIKLSAQHDIYKRADPYFFSAFYMLNKVEEGKAEMTLDISVKYLRFDELQYGIIRPEDDLNFTDKIRANSGACCYAKFPRMNKEFECDGSEESIPVLCEDLLDFLKGYVSDFLKMVEREYGDLDGYYIANKDDDPLLAGLAYLDRGDCEGAIECFSSEKMSGEHNLWSVEILTDEQYARAKQSGQRIYETSYERSIHRSRKDQFKDYATALKNNLEWNHDRAMYGLLEKETNKP